MFQNGLKQDRKRKRGVTTTTKNLKYLDYAIACQEVPNEISLVFNVSGCPYHCKGCHSPELWEYKGFYINYDLQFFMDKYKGMITCVCFMGGDQNMIELDQFLAYIKSQGLKTCVYSGCDKTDKFDISLLDYLKVGHYEEKYGGLNEKTTNQRFYKINNGALEDITYVFQRSKENE